MQQLAGNRRADGFGILMYHRIADPVPGVGAPTWNVTPAQFRRQMSGLLEHGFEAWPLSRLIEARRNLRVVPARAFAVTFDDGYQNNFTQGLPVLRDLRIPATIFLATRYLDSQEPFPFDDWPASGSELVPKESWLPLSTAECQELLSSGLIEFGAHTHSHERFIGRPDDFRADLSACLGVLEDRFGIEEPTFAFPYGAADTELLEIARDAGVACALTTAHRRVGTTDGEFGWSRFNVLNSNTPAILAAKLSGWYASVAAVRNALASPFLGLGPLLGLGRLARKPSFPSAPVAADGHLTSSPSVVSRS
jgi:peptidoglycan/xylan/chitin deacetylase (PgdA/CDA1 family)